MEIIFSQHCNCGTRTFSKINRTTLASSTQALSLVDLSHSLVAIRKVNSHDVYFHVRTKVTWAIYIQVKRHGRDHATGIGAGFSLENVCLSALSCLELCRHFEVTYRKDCIELAL